MAGSAKLPADAHSSTLPAGPEPERYTRERVAQFLLEGALTHEGYLAAREEVRKLGLDPDQVPHEPPE